MKKIFLTLAILAGMTTNAQVKIGDNVTSLDASSLLELETTNKGLLYPRVALQSTDSYLPLESLTKQRGMTVYNTATTTTGTNDVSEGLYTNDGSNWIKVTPKTLYTDNAAITSARTVTLNNNDLTFTAGVGGTGKTVVASTFKTGGAVYGNVRIEAAQITAATWTATDYAIIGTSQTTIELPNASNNLGRIISLTNQSGGTRSYVGSDANFKPLNTSTLVGGKGQLMIATTLGWQIIGGY
jgi:hypothetical protein